MKNLKKRILSITAIIVGSVVLAGCSNQNAKNVKFSIPTDISTLDPTTMQDQYSYDVIGNVQEGLMRINAKGNPTNALAKSVDVSKDGLTYTITLKPNLKWSNGDKLTAQDFVYSWQRAINPATGAEYAYLMAPVKNADKLNAMKATNQSDLDTLGIKADSDTQLTVTLEQPTPYFEFLLSYSVYYPLDKKVVEKEGKSFGTDSSKMVYSGPFMFKKSNGWTGTNKKFTIYANPNYWDKKNVKSKEIEFQVVTNANSGVSLYKSNKLDFALLSTSNLIEANKSQKGFTVYKQARTDYIEYNQTGKVPALQNKNIREAFNLATDRKAIVDTALPYSTPATSFSPIGFAKAPNGEDFATYVKQNYTYDQAKAKQLWTKGLKELGIKDLTLSFEYASDLAPSKATANYLQTAWEKVLPGLKINTKGVPFTQRIADQNSQNFEVILAGWGGDYAEPTTFLQLGTTGAPYNDGKFSSAVYDKAYKDATTTNVLDATKRNEDYKTCETALFEGSYMNPIDFQASPALVNPKLKGLEFHSTGLTYDLKKVYIK